MQDSRRPTRQPPGKPLLSNITFSLTEALGHFRVHLKAGLKSQETIDSYTAAVTQATTFLHNLGLADNVAAISGEHLELFLADLGGRVSPATVVNRFKGLRAFFKWLEREGEIQRNPMARLAWPKLEEETVNALTPADVKAMIATCGRDFVGRRDAALIGCLVDTGWRVSEVLAVTVEMVHSGEALTVRAKGKKYVQARLSPYVREMVNRYLRLRRSERPQLWLARTGKAMTRHSVWEILSYRSHHAGLAPVHPHMLRHSHAMWWLQAGGNVMDLKENLGHSSIRVTERYLQYLAKERAMDARRQFGPGNRLME